MQLEVVRTPGEGPSRPVDVLLVHGSYCSASVWQPHVMPFLAAQGYTVHALSLRGHGGSQSAVPLARVCLADYVADLTEATERIGRPVAVVGHSLGGAVVQWALMSGVRFAGTALLASVPPSGMLMATQRMFWSRPRLWFELSRIMHAGVGDADPEILRDGLFDNRVSEEEYRQLAAQFCDESPLAIQEMLGLRWFGASRSQAGPTLVMGGSRDWLIGEADVRQTAFWYGTKPVIVRGLSHVMMLDPDWEIPARLLCEWLDELAPRDN